MTASQTAGLDANRPFDIDEIAHTYALSKAQLAETIGVGRETLYKVARAQADKTQRRLHEMLVILWRIGG